MPERPAGFEGVGYENPDDQAIRALLDPWRGKNEPPAAEESRDQAASKESKR